MRQHDVGAWLHQETWAEGDNFDTEIGGYHVFCHNADRGTTSRQHLFRGVAIILSPQFHEAWKLAGSPPPITIDPGEDFTGRLLRLNLKFDSFDKKGRKIKGQSFMIALISTYFPCDNKNHDRFCTILDSMLNSINVNTNIILGGDINARIGTRTCDKHMQVLGPYGIRRSNARGKNLLHVLAGHKLRIENTFSIIGRKTMPHTPASPRFNIHMGFQACTMYLHTSTTAKWYLTVW